MNCKGMKYLLAALLFGACTESELLMREGETFAVQFSASGISAEVTTRSSLPLANDVTLRILAFRRVGTAPDLSKDECMGEGTYKAGKNDGTLIAVTPLLLRAGTYDFYALTPDLTVTYPDDSGSSLTCTVSVGHGTDYATSLTQAKTVDEASPAVKLDELGRHCTKLVFELSPKAGNITSVSIVSAGLTNMTQSPVVTPLHSLISLTGAGKSEEVTIDGSKFSEPDAGNNTSASTVVLPREAGAFQFKMKASFNGKAAVDFVADMPETLVFAPGTKYTLSMKMKGSSIELSLEVAPWGDETIPGQDDMGAGAPITILIGKWTGVDYDASTGDGNTAVDVGTWQTNPDLDAELGKYDGLTLMGSPLPWESQEVPSSGTGDGNMSLDGSNSWKDVTYGGSNESGLFDTDAGDKK